MLSFSVGAVVGVGALVFLMIGLLRGRNGQALVRRQGNLMRSRRRVSGSHLLDSDRRSFETLSKRYQSRD